MLVVACSSATGGGSTTTLDAIAPGTEATATTEPAFPTTVPVTTPRAAGCPEQGGFVDGGRVMRVDQPASDTNTLGLISWLAEEGCERFTLRFETTEGAPATTPPTVVVEFLASRQVLRVWTDAESTVVTEQLVETGLVERLYAVRALDGGIFIDFHLEGPAQARAEVSNSPASLTLELESGVQPFDSSSVVAGNTVVITPGPGTQVVAGTPLEVAGYARVFEANVSIIATIGDQLVAQTSTTASDWTDTWGEFMAPLQLPPGDVTLFVGEQSPADGQLVGATVSLTVR